MHLAGTHSLYSIQAWSTERWSAEAVYHLYIIFRGLGGSHYDEERKLYHKDVLVTFQKKVSSLIDFVVHKMLII